MIDPAEMAARAEIAARVAAFELVHRPHGATAHRCRDVLAGGPLCFHAECRSCETELIIPIATATGEPLISDG